MGTCVMVVRGTAGRIMGTAAVAMGTVVVATGAGTAFFFFLDRKGMLAPPQHKQRKQQMPRARRNQAHQGQPPPSVDVVVAIKRAAAPGLSRGAPPRGRIVSRGKTA